MRLTLKLTLTYLLVCIAVLALNARLRVERERESFEAQRLSSHRVLGALVAATVAEVWAQRGVEAARDVLVHAQTASPTVRLRLVCAVPDNDALPAGLTCEALRTMRGRDVRSVVERDDSRHSAHLTYIAVPVDEARTEVLEIRESLDEEHRFMKASVYSSVTTATLVVLICGLASFLAGLTFVGVPARRLIAKAERVGKGDLGGPLALRQNDELGDVAHAMDAMCDQLSAERERAERESRARLRAFDQLRHAERLTTVGNLASGFAHEVGTPLNVIEARASTIADGTTDGDRARASAGAIVVAVEQITHIVRALLDFARRKGESAAPMEARALVENAVQFITPMGARRGISLETVFEDGGARVHGDSLQLSQSVINLVLNAIQASPEGETVRVEVSAVESAPPSDLKARGKFVRIAVADRGPGVAAEHRDRVFEPFFTTKDVGEGTGLGLSIAWGIVAEHGGWITLDDRPGGGSIFQLFLPRAAGVEVVT